MFIRHEDKWSDKPGVKLMMRYLIIPMPKALIGMMRYKSNMTHKLWRLGQENDMSVNIRALTFKRACEI